MAVTDAPRPEKPYARRTLPTNPSMMFLHASIFLPWLFLCSAILIIINRIHRNQFNALTIAFVAFTFSGLLPAVRYAVSWDVALRDYAYKAWLATFDEDWDTSGRYKTWWWIFGVNKKRIDVGDAVERWMGSKGTRRGRESIDE